MKIEVDQSGKIENTNKPTVIAFSNGKSASIIIAAKDKKLIQTIYRKIDQPRIFTYKLFAVLIFILIKTEIKKFSQIVIDKEYPGYENLIKDILCETAVKNRCKIDRTVIHFRSIGRKSKAHDLAVEAYRNKKADMKLSAKEFYKIAFK